MRELKVIPIVHTQEETRIKMRKNQRKRIKQAWKEIRPMIDNAYKCFEEVQLYVDGFAIPENFKNSEMDADKYKDKWIERLLNLDSPLGDVVNRLLSKGAILMSTEINKKDFWLEYKKLLRRSKGNASKDLIRGLDKMDAERNKFIERNIDVTLAQAGLLLIGRKHLKQGFNFADSIEVEYL